MGILWGIGERMKPSEMTDTELIHAVATEVMGWHKGYGSTPADAPIWLDADGKYAGFYVLCKSPYTTNWKAWIRELMWTPLTDMNHLWMVVERMRELEWSINIDDISGEWKVYFHRCLYFDPIQKVAINSSLSHAILEAALEAVTGDQSNG